MGESIRGRYVLVEAVGKGGMAAVFRATDSVTRRDVALKQLVVSRTKKHYAESVSLFEREFRTLAQLAHPRIIEVYDFGIAESGPFYTMELLDGGDLRERVPLPWREACAIAYDICSSLALIHSRRLVHRDLTPRNVRCTRDGRAKLIDFGAMVPMGFGEVAVGTPSFMAPEVVYRSYLDARTDLFSLGATLYFALTSRSPYPAKNLIDVVSAWNEKPLPPSHYSPGIPASLDALVLSLIGTDRATRPRTAFEVMHRLAAVSGSELDEPALVSRAYLSTPVMVGRQGSMETLGAAMKLALGGKGQSVLVEGVAGTGRSRVLDACALLAETLGARVLRARGNATELGAFRTAQRLAEGLVRDSPDAALRAAKNAGAFDVLFAATGDDAHPELVDLRSSKASRYALQNALGRWFFAASELLPIVISVDDVQGIDEPSFALLATLATNVASERIFIVATAETGAEPTDRFAFDVLSRHSAQVELGPLSRSEIEQLFESVFGDVPNLGTVSDGIHAIARGNPRASMDLAQHLVDRGVVHYDRGSWTLPSRLDARDLPRDAEDAIRTRISALSPLARSLAETQALATYRAFSRDDYGKVRAAAASDGDVDAAITELCSQQVVTSDGSSYSLAHAGWTAALVESLSEEERAQRHRSLATLYEGKSQFGVVRHALLGGLEERALDELSPLLPGLPEAATFHELTDLGSLEVAATFERALSAAERLERSPLEVNHLRRWVTSLSVISDDKYYFRAGPAWLARLKHDSGYDDWERNAAISDPAERLSTAMQAAFGRYGGTPERERVHRPDEAIKGLAHYVGISLAVGSSRLDLDITESLPALLEPFASVSPLVRAIWQNAIAARESSCRSQWEAAHDRWVKVYEELSGLEKADPELVGVFRRAVAYAIGANEATMGIDTATTWASRLDDDPVQRVNGLYIRRIERLQNGDLDGAETFRKQAELLALQARARQMFSHLNWVELMVAGMARDVTAVKQCADRIVTLALRSSGWACYVDLAEGLFRLSCDDFEAAHLAFERAIAKTAPRESGTPLATCWCLSVAGTVESLTALGRLEQAQKVGEGALGVCAERGIGVAAHGISRALAIAEARLGDAERARTRIDSVIRDQIALGIGGVHLGASYEARARVAIALGDPVAFAKYAELAGQLYGHGGSSPLGARLERLTQEGAGAAGAAGGADATLRSRLANSSALVSEVMTAAASPFERAECALDLLCKTTGATDGHLYFLTSTELRLDASRNAPPPAGLLEFLQASVDQVREDFTTQVADDANGLGSPGAAFVDAEGLRYQALFLSAGTNDGLRYVAVAALGFEGKGEPVAADLATAIGNYLASADVGSGTTA